MPWLHSITLLEEGKGFIMRQATVLVRPTVRAEASIRYAVTLSTLLPVLSLFLLPLAPFVYFFTRYQQRRFYETLEILLTTRELVVRRGVWFKEEKTIPLEKITDVALLEGPLMRAFGIKSLRVETAGQIGAGAGLVNLVGVENPEAFRDDILGQRDRISESDASGNRIEGPAHQAGSLRSDAQTTALLREIRDSLRRMEQDR